VGGTGCLPESGDDPASIVLRAATADDDSFVIEMARQACVIEDRPLPTPTTTKCWRCSRLLGWSRSLEIAAARRSVLYDRITAVRRCAVTRQVCRCPSLLEATGGRSGATMYPASDEAVSEL
jgi:hypothetical protein